MVDGAPGFSSLKMRLFTSHANEPPTPLFVSVGEPTAALMRFTYRLAVPVESFPAVMESPSECCAVHPLRGIVAVTFGMRSACDGRAGLPGDKGGWLLNCASAMGPAATNRKVALLTHRNPSASIRRAY